VTNLLDIKEFLLWIAVSGGAAVLFSWVAEQVGWFQKQVPKTKWWISMLGSVVLAVGAKLIIDFVPAETLAAIAPYFAIVAAVVVSFVANQVAHALDPNKK